MLEKDCFTRPSDQGTRSRIRRFNVRHRNSERNKHETPREVCPMCRYVCIRTTR